MTSQEELQGLIAETPNNRVEQLHVRKQTADFLPNESSTISRWLNIVGHVTSLYALILFVMGCLVFTATSSNSLAQNPLAKSQFATWSLTSLSLLVLICTPCRTALLDHGANLQCNCRQAMTRLETLLLLAVVVVLLTTSASACMWKVLRPSQFQTCFCDSLVATGSPNYKAVPANLTIAFVGDSSIADGDEVLSLIKKEGASAVVFNGDTSYMRDEGSWIARFRAKLRDIPFFVAASMEGDDSERLHSLQEETAAHWASSHMTECKGEVGVSNLCTHQGVGFLLSGSASPCVGRVALHKQFFEETLDEFAKRTVRWPICVFHFMDNRDHHNSVLEDYDLCLQRGALIITPLIKSIEPTSLRRIHREGQNNTSILREGHSVLVLTDRHSAGHSRAFEAGFQNHHQYSSMGNETWKVDSDTLVDNLGIRTERPEDENGGSEHAHAVLHQAGQRKEQTINGAFFCRFHVNGDPGLAKCYFKAVSGIVSDSFYLRRPVASGRAEPSYV
eukprot:TRINITY_DN92256_c0_g1_i1.p1 TRINITY_DN92256_c0_g1~~TRINITY_DN92256_c0_g1_i1.p1  ORF type:complete len:530 (-),score=59.47 TRINITY_DN92256_c0_g1_i1:243-1757(-)